MQSRIRKSRSIKSIRRSRVFETTCVSLILLSCTSTNNENIKNAEEIEFSSRVCINSSGRGRLKVGKESHRFTYQAASKENKYTLGIDIPFKGQETLVLPLSDGGELSGTLYKNVMESLLGRRELKTAKTFDEFLHNSADFFESIEKIQNNACSKTKCLKGTISQVSGGEVYRSAWSKKYELVVKFKRISKGHYKSVRVQAYNQNSKKTPLSLDLALESCQ